MPVITTKNLGLDPATANPKPVTGFNYAGQPMKPGEHYNGRPEHMGKPAEASPGASQRTIQSHSQWTPERRAAFGQKMRNYWQAKRNQKQDQQP